MTNIIIFIFVHINVITTNLGLDKTNAYIIDMIEPKFFDINTHYQAYGELYADVMDY